MLPRTNTESLPLLTTEERSGEILQHSELVADLPIHSLIQRNDISAISERIKSDQNIVVTLDEFKASPLHYCASYNNIQIAKLLLQNLPNDISKQEYIKLKGGEMEATALLWAVKNQKLQFASWIIDQGADLTVKDKQLFTAFHLCAQNFDLLMFIYLLVHSNKVDLNARDCFGQTVLHWIAYKNFHNAKEWIRLLRNRVDMNVYDKYGMTALHWAVTQRNFGAVTALIQFGADVSVKTTYSQESDTVDVGLNAMDLAISRDGQKYGISWFKRAMEKAEREKDGSLIYNCFTKREMMIMWFLPSFLIVLNFFIVDYVPWYWSLALAFTSLIGCNLYINNFVLKNEFENCKKSPLLASIVVGTLICCVYVLYFVLFPYMYFTDIMPALVICSFVSSVSIYNFYLTVTKDPGVISRRRRTNSTSENENQTMVYFDENEVLELSKKGSLDERFYCTTCLMKRPIRSKHCKQSDVCTAIFDHWCPWVANAIGYKNHPNFFIFLLTLVASFELFLFLLINYILQQPVISPIENCDICGYFYYYTSLCGLLVWLVINNIWTLIILLSQMYNISCNITTNESINSWRYDYMKDPNNSKRFYNPFDLGFFENWKTFLFPEHSAWRHVNWEQQYDVPSRFRDIEVDV